MSWRRCRAARCVFGLSKRSYQAELERCETGSYASAAPAGGRSPSVGRYRRAFDGGVVPQSCATASSCRWPGHAVVDARSRHGHASSSRRRASPCLQSGGLHRRAGCSPEGFRLARDLPIKRAHCDDRTAYKEEEPMIAHTGLASPRLQSGETFLRARARAARLHGEDGGRPIGGFQRRQEHRLLDR